MSKNDKEFVKEITAMEVDFPQWYTDVILKTDLVDYSPVKGFMVIKPYGYAIWENIQNYLDKKFKETGHKNCYFPLLIPESLLKKEAEHVEGFAPEVAWVTHGGKEKLAERLCVRPTSETIICSMYAKWLKSYRELPYLYNQWCSVVRWEKSTRPFLRTSEFLWQEGHTLHETEEEAQEETLRILEIYREMAENLLAMPVITGRKSDKEKFAGAHATYTMEALMHDGKALQAGTSHNLGQHFTKAFEITFLDRNGDLQNPYHTSWGVSTRLIGGLIMVHGDNRGLVLPPRVAPIQVVIIPIAQHKEGVLDKAYELKKLLQDVGVRVELDDNENYSPGWKFNEYEMKGVPVRIEIGPRDIQNNQVMAVRRDTLEKQSISMDGLADSILNLLDTIHNDMLERARKHRDENTYYIEDFEDLKKKMTEKLGFAKAMWCGERECEDNLKAETGATIRCIPFKQEDLGDKCHFCGKKAKHMVYVAKAY
ncbi:prolyl-tRNA synthetase [Caminicella sporogenes DSM 14501]|uniref:Proline--tRNA ligase n=1 Tax=Caminicella sporogenes DSM 14501 TaxID=1121266 RepID=A0A1M6SRQ8_9FIRM|nr:proline--tRNA ligase [Caminicella sporogenes]RKD26415.1 proline--tRNA ligase [Caminicella sporogenes]WIF95623.1 proline--tRNA ligase [Caminicella sporogenes]SHK47278.1 prolyl-tRNA synthetase [Caminicella sporogenes DSM 14501]